MNRVTKSLLSCPQAATTLIRISIAWCCTLLLFSLEAKSQPTLEPALSAPISEELKSIGTLRDNLRAFLKNSKREDNSAVQSAAVLNLCQLHAWVVADRRYHTSEALKGIRATCATRLKTYSKNYQNSQKRLARRQGELAGAKPALSRSRFGGPEAEFGDHGNGANRDKGGYSQANDPSSEALGLGSSVADNVSGSFSGGAGQFANYVGNFGPDGDHGPELVALIEATLNPDYWRTHGGPGSIHYYRPGLALVVTASQEMQDRVRSLLLQLK